MKELVEQNNFHHRKSSFLKFLAVVPVSKYWSYIGKMSSTSSKIATAAATSSSNESNSFAWKLIADDVTLSAGRKVDLSEAEVLQLKGMFIHFDEDRDGLLTTEQLNNAVSELGFPKREEFIRKFCVNSMQLKAQGLSPMAFKTDFKTFVTVIAREVKNLKLVERDLDALFSFMDTNKTGFVSRKDVRYYLADLASPTHLSPNEYTRFIRNIQFPPGRDTISIEELKKQLLFHYCE